jgi:two-component system, OmpR family, heavy metal sensor histidine kinase CusS
MMSMSLRLRLTAWYALVLLLGLSVFGFSMWIFLQHRLMDSIDTRLAQRIKGLNAAIGQEAKIRDRTRLLRELDEFVHEAPDSSMIQLRDSSGTVLSPGADQPVLPAASKRTSPHTEIVSGHEFRVAPSRLESAGSVFDVQVAIPLDESRAIMQSFRELLLLLIPAVLTVSCLGGYWLSSRALRPVDKITRVARSIGVHNLSQRVAVPQTGDEIARMAQTWNEVLDRLETSVGRIRQFTSDASHELRTPLALIRATAELALRRDRDPDDYRASLRQIEQDAARMTDLTESLLTLARADADALEMTIQPTDLGELARSVVEQSGAAAADACVTLRALTPGQPAEAQADASGIRRVLLILVDNALKHTQAGGTVTVSVENHARGVSLSVEDTGNGIPEEALPHIFERFYRADAARGSSGFGLGLSIAQAIAHAHRTEIQVSSLPGSGSSFYMSLAKA